MPLSDLSVLRAASRGEPGVCIAVLDGPIDRAHPVFREAELTLDDDRAPGDGPSLRHGTHIVSVIFGGAPIEGVAPGCRGRILPIYVDDEGGEVVPCSQRELATRLIEAVDAGAQIINVSGGRQLAAGDEADRALVDAVAYCVAHDVLIVAAAGNDGCACTHIPAALPDVLAIGALGDDGAPLALSNWGEAYRGHGLLVPGDRIAGALPGGGTTTDSGTSYATAIASGVVALLLGIARQANPRASPYAIRDALLASARPCIPTASADCQRFLAGSLDVSAALALIRAVNDLPRQGEHAMHDEPAELAPSTPAPVADAILPSGCGCGGGASGGCGCNGGANAAAATAPPAPDAQNKPATMTLVYALGVVGYDFRSQARLDSITQDGLGVLGVEQWNPHDPRQILAYLEKAPWEASSLIWTLKQEASTIYAIVPGGAFSAEVYQRLREFLKAQLDEGVERVSIPGVAAGFVKLMSGQTVPVIVPTLRGMYSWSTPHLVTAAVGAKPTGEPAVAEHARKVEGVRNFLDRVYYELRNMGITPEDRAINYAATNAFQAAGIFSQAVRETMELDEIAVERSPMCREGSECFDVKLSFFDPERQNQRARRQHRFTIDVSDVVPVTVGRTRAWSLY